MANIFTSGSHNQFSWEKLGNIKDGRENLGEDMPVIVYRLLEYAMNDILNKEYGSETANELFRKAGYLAGSEMAKNILDLSLGMDAFIPSLQKTLINLKIGILRVEQYDEKTGDFTLTIAEDLDCSGLPPTNEVVCIYDEGFLQGIMEVYTGKPYKVREVDCWASGERVCRFHGETLGN
ncbi:MAG: 4-vinyl reductase [Lachnospiraceae bacterium]|nr:4-vinyl reductase [Lachnospiraceae bacterium]